MNHGRFIHQTTQMQFLHWKAVGFVHHKRPSECLLSSTVWQIPCRRGGWGCCAPHPDKRRGHMTSHCLPSWRLHAAKRSSCISVSPVFLREICVIGFMAWESKFNTLILSGHNQPILTINNILSFRSIMVYVILLVSWLRSTIFNFCRRH